jgi:hypothetical protein
MGQGKLSLHIRLLTAYITFVIYVVFSLYNRAKFL